MRPEDAWEQHFLSYLHKPKLVCRDPHNPTWEDVAFSLATYELRGANVDFCQQFPQVPAIVLFDKLFEDYLDASQRNDTGLSEGWRRLQNLLYIVGDLNLRERAVQMAALMIQKDKFTNGFDLEIIFQNFLKQFPEELTEDVVNELSVGVTL